MIVRLQPVLGPAASGILMTPEEFDRLTLDDVEEGWRYELINGVFVVSPIPSVQEADPNDELGYLLRRYHEDHPQGATLNATLAERYVYIGQNRRRPDRVIWAGLGRMPRRRETPTIVAEFVSAGRRSWLRDYEHKRDEYMSVDVKEYWIIDRFERTLTVFTRPARKIKKRIFKVNQIYTTDLLPGFELPLARLLDRADRWAGAEEETAEE